MVDLRYAPLTQIELDALGALQGFAAPTWRGPALPKPVSESAVAELLDMVDRIARRGQYLIQAKDGLSKIVTLRGITAPAERFMLGTRTQIEQAAAVDALLTAIESVLQGSGILHDIEHLLSRLLGTRSRIANCLAAHALLVGSGAAPTPAAASPDDYSAFPLEDMSQYAMGWTTLQDVSRLGYPHLPLYVAAATDPSVATEQFWPSLSSTALPYNLLVLRRLQPDTAATYRNAFGRGWTSAMDAMLSERRLYGIDMTIFAGSKPFAMSNGTIRFTPSTLMLLEMGGDKRLRPIAVLVSDPQNSELAQVYTEASANWIYGLLAVKTSLTVFGIWVGHVYTMHLIAAAMQMAMWNTLPPEHIVALALRPQSQFTIAFDFLLLLGWSHLAPPSSIGDTGAFLELCSRYADTHDFFSTDPLAALESLGLDEAAFTSAGGAAWDLYPNVQKMLRVWEATSAYVDGVVGAGYTTDADVANDLELQAWIKEASAQDGGNVRGLPRLDGRSALRHVLTSLLYRINFHAMGRLRSMGAPAPSFAPNFPPCLQTTTIPRPDESVTTAGLLRDYLPRAGTVGDLVSFYDLFAFCTPYVPFVPDESAEADPFFDEARFPGANAALFALRQNIGAFVAELQPDWVEVGQWPRSIEL